MWALYRSRLGALRYRAYSTYKSFANVGTPRTYIHEYRRPLIAVGAVGAVIYVSNLQQVPVSNRWRFMIVPDWLEKKLGDLTYKQVMMQFRGELLPDNSPDVVAVKQIMSRLIKVSGLENRDIDWQVHVVAGKYPPNAFVLPGGKVFVFKSMFPITRNENGLATVLSHELAHQVCRHTSENMSKSPLYFLLGAAMYGVTGSGGIERLLMNALLKLPASRAMESEADYVGLMMMAKACFDPTQAVGLWQRMVAYEKQSGMSMPEFLSTHPASSRRITDLEEDMPKATRVRAEHCDDAHFWNAALLHG